MPVNNAMSTENEQMKKLQSQNQPKLAQVSQVVEKILETLESLKAEIAQVKSQLKEQKETTKQNASPDYAHAGKETKEQSKMHTVSRKW